MKIKKYSVLLGVLLFLMVSNSCKKFLEVKPDKRLVIPSTLNDLQGLLDYYPNINGKEPVSSEVSADDYYLESDVWNALGDESSQRMYIWAADFLFDSPPNDWSKTYSSVYVANTILENIDKIKRNDLNAMEWDNVKGQAFFLRGKSFFNMASIFSLAYDESSSSIDLGIPLRLNTDFNEKSERANLEVTYDQIIHDLKQSISLLPVTPKHVMRASRPAAYALLARTFLYMRKYEEAYAYADSCLQLKDDLINYNELDSSRMYPIPRFNEEVIYACTGSTPRPITNTRALIDTNLYELYETTDRRKSLFFKPRESGGVYFTGGYDGSGYIFTGLSTDEVYLIKAECAIRKGNNNEGIDILNVLLQNRYTKDSFYGIQNDKANEALEVVLEERRKELLMRGLRWMDIKRLNKEGRNIVLRRVINGKEYTLEPNDLRYALAIPEDIIKLSGIEQNRR